MCNFLIILANEFNYELKKRERVYICVYILYIANMFYIHIFIILTLANRKQEKTYRYVR